MEVMKKDARKVKALRKAKKVNTTIVDVLREMKVGDVEYWAKEKIDSVRITAGKYVFKSGGERKFSIVQNKVEGLTQVTRIS